MQSPWLNMKAIVTVCFLAAWGGVWGQYFVDFEDGTKGAYASGTVTLNGIDWNFTEAVIGNLPDDFKNGSKSARLRGRNGSIISMLENKANGIGEISFDYRRFGTDGAQQPWAVEYSVNGGTSWTQVGPLITATAVEQTFSQGLDIPGDIRIRIRLTTEPGASGDRRFNVDDILITDYAPTCTDVPTDAPTNLVATGIVSDQFNISWNDVSEFPSLVVIKETTPLSVDPVDGITYSPNASYGLGDPIDGGFVNFASQGESSVATGLNAGTIYHVEIFSYCDDGYLYNTTTSLSGQVLTEPADPSFNPLCSSSTEIVLSWDNPLEGNWDGFVILGREGAAPTSINSVNPLSLSPNSNFAAAPTEGVNKILYRGNGNTETITGITNGASYTFRVLAYRTCLACVNIFEYSTGTQATQVAGISEVINYQAFSFSSDEIDIQWQNPSTLCFDQILVAVNDGGTITASPVDLFYAVNSNNFSDLTNPTLSDGSTVLYFGTASSTSIEGLNGSDEYCMKVFVLFNGIWSVGVEICRVPGEGTPLNPGDLVFIGIDTWVVSGGTDKISLLNLKEITTGTSFNLSNMVYEHKAPANVSTGRWYNGNGNLSNAPPFATITYTGSAAVPAGSVWCFEIVGAGSIGTSNFFLNGSPIPSSDYNVTYQSGASNSFIAIASTSPDAIFLSQGIFSQPFSDEDGDLYVTFSGNVLGAFQSRGTFQPITLAGNAGGPRVSREYPGLDCFNISFSSDLSRYFAYYDGGTYSGTQYSLLGEVTDFANWDSGQGGDSDDLPDEFCNTTFNVTAPNSVGQWIGGLSADWFDCRNWENLIVPDETIDVSIMVTPEIGADPAIANSGAKCKNLIIDNGLSLTLSTTSSALSIYGDLTYNGYFYGNSGIVSFVGSGNQDLIRSAGIEVDFVVQDMAINKPSGRLLLSEIIQVNGELNFQQGNIELVSPDALVEFAAGSSTTGASNSSFVDGKVRKIGDSEFTFPIGDVNAGGTPFYQPARIFDFTAPSTIEAQYFAEDPSLTYPSTASPGIGRCDYWVVEKPTESDGDVHVALNYTNTHPEYCNEINDPDQLRFSVYNGSEWDEIPSAGFGSEVISDDEIGFGVDSDYGPFVLSSTSNLNVLPITLLSFSAQAAGKNLVETHWSTASETNNDYFTIERSRDAAFWEPIGFVPGAGNSNTTRYYSLSDDAPFPGLSYYRLKQTDFDGSFAYSYVVPVQIDQFGADLALIQAYRDGDKLALLYTAESPQIRVELYSVVGQKLHSINVENTDGFVRINLPQLAHGVYIVRISSGTDMATAKFFY